MAAFDPVQRRCGVHPDVDAAFVCQRCGTFGCESCRARPSEDECRSCADRAAADSLKPVPLGEAFGAAFMLPRRYWRESCVYLAVSCVTSWVWTAVAPHLLGEAPDISKALTDWAGAPNREFSQLNAIFQPLLPRAAVGTAIDIVGWVLWLLATGAVTLAVVGGHSARPLTLTGAYAGAAKRLLSLVAVNALVNLCAVVGLVACVLPGVACLVAGCFVDPFVLVGGRGPFAAFAASARLARRAVWAALLLLLASVTGQWLLNRGVSMLGGATLQSALRVLVERLADLPIICGVAYLYARLGGPRSTELAIATRSG